MQTKLRGENLAKIGQEDNSNCPTCGVCQDGFHLILDCRDSEELRTLLRGKKTPSTKWEFFDILSDVHLADIIADFVLSNNINI